MVDFMVKLLPSGKVWIRNAKTGDKQVIDASKIAAFFQDEYAEAIEGEDAKKEEMQQIVKAVARKL